MLKSKFDFHARPALHSCIGSKSDGRASMVRSLKQNNATMWRPMRTMHFIIFCYPPRHYFWNRGGRLLLKFFFGFLFPVGWANLLIFKIFQGSEAAVPILLVPKYIPGHTMWLLLISLSHMVFLAHPLNLMSSYPPNLLPSSSPPLSGPESSFGPRILFF